jgi:PAS domain S-box-containing protein
MDLNAHWQDICHAIQEGVFLVDPSGRIVMVNEAMARLTGYSSQELTGKSCTLFTCDACEASRRQARGGWCRLFEGHPGKPRRCHIARKDGLRVPVLKNQTLIRDSGGKVLGAVETIMDLSDLDRLDRKVEELTRRLDEPGVFHGMVGASPAMRSLYETLSKAALSDAPVMLLGESGTGKELAAHALHELGARSGGPFVTLNCAALNESLLESELFGHAKGAFTGAYRARRGRFEEADGGDIFLDEIGDAPLSIQVKLLRTLETRTIERVGESRPVPVNARLITATHQDLRAHMARGLFREDFFYRIHVIPIALPPLRARMEDAPLLVEHFLRRIRERGGKNIEGVTPEAMRAFMEYHWPGNVRELKSALEYGAVLAGSGRIDTRHLPPGLADGRGLARGRGAGDGREAAEERGAAEGRRSADGPSGLEAAAPHARFRQSAPPPGWDTSALHARTRPHAAPAGQASGAALPAGEREALIEALRASDGNKTQAARILGVTRLTVQNRMRKYGVTCERDVRF